MGKTYLTKEELGQFPTIEEIDTLFSKGNNNPDTWGLCYNQNSEPMFQFRSQSDDWVLLLSIEDIFEDMCEDYDDSDDFSKLVLFYGIEYPDYQKIFTEIIDTYSDEEAEEINRQRLEDIGLRH